MALTPEQRSELGRLIDERHGKLMAEVREEVGRSREETFGTVAGPVTDTGDEAVADLLSDLDTAEVSRDLQELRELQAAQARLANGTYGTCVACGREIEFERLIALPAAVRCLACQELHERTYAHPSEPKL
jgi:RNA polymerase-binding transcription factor DksA